MRTILVASILVAAGPVGCGRTASEGTGSSPSTLQDASPASSLPTSRSGILARYVDASALDGISRALAHAGFSPCAQAFDTGTSTGAPPTGADRAEYVAACERLPLAVQRCLGLLYAGAHAPECEAVLRGLDPPTRAEVDRLQRLRPTTR